MKQEFSKQEQKENLKENCFSSHIDTILNPEASYKTKYKALVKEITNKK